MNNHDCHSGNNSDFVDQDTIDGIQRYPFLQMYAPTVEPSNSSILRVRGLSIAFLNINGSAFNKIRSDHPYLFQLIKMHKIDIIAFIDTRYPTNPSWSIPGFTLVSRKSPINYPNNTIGGIMIYKRYNLTNKIKLFARPNRFDSLSISVSDTNDSTSLFSFNYCRPYRNECAARSSKFYKYITDLVTKNDRNFDNIYVVGDFNARLGYETGDKRFDYKHGPMIHNFMNQTNMKIANPIWADGVLTCLSKQNNGTSGSIIDYVFTNDLNTIDSLKIDTHPVYSDH
eukprot:213285_1